MIAHGAGWVVRTLGETVIASLPGASVGGGVRIHTSTGASLCGEIAAVERSRVAIVPFGPLGGIAVGDRVAVDSTALAVPLGFAAFGRAIDATGAALDGRGPLAARAVTVGASGAPSPGSRQAVRAAFWTGVPVIDGLLTIGRGARVGFFGAPGAGKTTLLEHIVAGAGGDAVVLALVGERGREAQAWFDRLDRRSTIVCATSDRSSAERVRAALVAMTQARLLRDRGLHVVLVLDSLARYAAALREQRVGLGEPVGRGGYPPSVWADLARYLECAGNASHGSITLLATVLSDGADEREPLSDATRSLLDGHIVLSSALARAGHYPAIDVLASTSRTMEAVVSPEHSAGARAVRAALAMLAESSDARAVGMAAASERLTLAVAAEPALHAFMRRGGEVAAAETLATLRSVAALLEARA